VATRRLDPDREHVEIGETLKKQESHVRPSTQNANRWTRIEGSLSRAIDDLATILADMWRNQPTRSGAGHRDNRPPGTERQQDAMKGQRWGTPLQHPPHTVWLRKHTRPRFNQISEM
jgi:hypothetical protein